MYCRKTAEPIEMTFRGTRTQVRRKNHVLYGAAKVAKRIITQIRSNDSPEMLLKISVKFQLGHPPTAAVNRNDHLCFLPRNATPLMLVRYMLSSCVCPCVRHKLMSANFTGESGRLYIKTLAVIKPMHRSVMFHFVSITAHYFAMPYFLVAPIKLIGNL